MNYFDSTTREKLTPAEKKKKKKNCSRRTPRCQRTTWWTATTELYVFDYGQSYSTIPVFISSDFLMHVFHVLFDRMFQSVEQKRFLPVLGDLTANLLRQSVEQMQGACGPLMKAAAKRNVAFLPSPRNS